MRNISKYFSVKIERFTMKTFPINERQLDLLSMIAAAVSTVIFFIALA